MQPVIVEHRGAVAVVRINRPERRNALTAAVKEALRDALAEAAQDPAVRAVLLTGAGSHFCAGQDLAEHAAALEASPHTVFGTIEEHYAPITRLLATMPKPVVAAVEGTCVGAGLGFALAADLRVFSAEAVLATAFTGIGLTGDSGLTYTLPRMVGSARAGELVLLGRTFSAEDAVAWGIAGEVVDAGTAAEAGLALAARLAAGPTLAYAESKALLADSGDLDRALAAEGEAQTRLGRTEDHRGAVAAFLAKSKPEFAGR
jgi:2-(1,2-epoxy-1,2-dihydrophenyl)acetyl-CoA isomerase